MLTISQARKSTTITIARPFESPFTGTITNIRSYERQWFVEVEDRHGNRQYEHPRYATLTQ